MNLRAGVLVLNTGVPSSFSDAENRGSLPSRAPGTAGETVSPRVVAGSALPGGSSRPAMDVAVGLPGPVLLRRRVSNLPPSLG